MSFVQKVLLVYNSLHFYAFLDLFLTENDDDDDDILSFYVMYCVNGRLCSC